MVAAVRPIRPARPTASGAPTGLRHRLARQDAEPLDGVQADCAKPNAQALVADRRAPHEGRGGGELEGTM